MLAGNPSLAGAGRGSPAPLPQPHAWTLTILLDEDHATPNGASRYAGLFGNCPDSHAHLEKARGVHGDEAKPFEAKLEMCDGAAAWTTVDLEDADLSRVRALLEEERSGRCNHPHIVPPSQPLETGTMGQKLTELGHNAGRHWDNTLPLGWPSRFPLGHVAGRSWDKLRKPVSRLGQALGQVVFEERTTMLRAQIYSGLK